MDFLVPFFFGLFIGIITVRVIISYFFIKRVIDKKFEYAQSLITDQVHDQDRDRMQGFILGLTWCEEQFIGKK